MQDVLPANPPATIAHWGKMRSISCTYRVSTHVAASTLRTNDILQLSGAPSLSASRQAFYPALERSILTLETVLELHLAPRIEAEFLTESQVLAPVRQALPWLVNGVPKVKTAVFQVTSVADIRNRHGCKRYHWAVNLRCTEPRPPSPSSRSSHLRLSRLRIHHPVG